MIIFTIAIMLGGKATAELYKHSILNLKKCNYGGNYGNVVGFDYIIWEWFKVS